MIRSLFGGCDLFYSVMLKSAMDIIVVMVRWRKITNVRKNEAGGRAQKAGGGLFSIFYNIRGGQKFEKAGAKSGSYERAQIYNNYDLLIRLGVE